MASVNDGKLVIFRGDDTGGSFGRTLAFTIEAAEGVSLDGCRAEWIFDGIVKEFPAPLVSGEVREVFYSHNETRCMALGVRYGAFRTIDAAGKVRTFTNTKAVEVTDNVARCYPGSSSATVRIGTTVTWEQVSGKPLLVKTINGEAPDADGDIFVASGGTVKSATVNGGERIMPTQDGNLPLVVPDPQMPTPVAPSTDAPDGSFAGAKETAQFVNSSINAFAAFYLTADAQGNAFATKAALNAAVLSGAFYNGGQPRTPTKNDYLIVREDESAPQIIPGVNPTTRYSFDGAQWAYQYTVNNTALTQAQVNAINSGIDAAKVALIRPLDDAVTQSSPNGVKSSGIFAWVKSLLPSWLTAGSEEPRSKTEMRVFTVEFTDWAVEPSDALAAGSVIRWFNATEYSQAGWGVFNANFSQYTPASVLKGDESSTELSWTKLEGDGQIILGAFTARRTAEITPSDTDKLAHTEHLASGGIAKFGADGELVAAEPSGTSLDPANADYRDPKDNTCHESVTEAGEWVLVSITDGWTPDGQPYGGNEGYWACDAYGPNDEFCDLIATGIAEDATTMTMSGDQFPVTATFRRTVRNKATSGRVFVTDDVAARSLECGTGAAKLSVAVDDGVADLSDFFQESNSILIETIENHAGGGDTTFCLKYDPTNDVLYYDDGEPEEQT